MKLWNKTKTTEYEHWRLVFQVIQVFVTFSIPFVAIVFNRVLDMLGVLK